MELVRCCMAAQIEQQLISAPLLGAVSHPDAAGKTQSCEQQQRELPE